MAAFHVVPLAVIYSTWWLIERPGLGTGIDPEHRGTGMVATGEADFLVIGIGATFSALGQTPVVAVLLGGTLAGGLLLAWGTLPRPELRRQASLPAALIVGGIVFYVLTGAGRWYLGVGSANSGRYLYIFAVLWLPALAVAVGRRGCPMVVHGPGLRRPDARRRAGKRLQVRHALPLYGRLLHQPEPAAVDDRPLGAGTPGAAVHTTGPGVRAALTVGWLLQAQHDGKLPATSPASDPGVKGAASGDPGGWTVQRHRIGRPCQRISGSMTLDLDEGARFGVSGGSFLATAQLPGGKPTPPDLSIPMCTERPARWADLPCRDASPFHLVISPVRGRIELCR